MKKNVILIFLLLIIFSPVLISSCEQTRIVNRNNAENCVFLEINHPCAIHLSKQECQILCNAFSRLNLYVSDGLWKTDITSADEINVSDELFEYMLRIVDATNNSCYRPLLTRSEGEPPYPYSCFAYALSNCVGGYSFDEINEWAVETYNLNGGIPSNHLEEAFSTWWGVDYSSYYSLSDIPNDISWDYSRTVIVFRSPSGIGHMANVIGRHSNGDFMVQDFSSDTVETYNLWRGLMIGVFVNTFIDTAACYDYIEP